MASVESIQAALADVVDPLFEQSLGQMRSLKVVSLDGNTARIKVERPLPEHPGEEELRESLIAAARQVEPSLEEVDVTFSTAIRGKDAGGRVGLKIKNIVTVGSGKGGVGKSTIAASLAFGLKELGSQVGLLDADVYGPSIPHMLGATGSPGVIERKTPNGQMIKRMVPLERDGIQLMSIGFLVEEEQAVIWRGPMLHKALQQFLQQTEWDELDYLIIDLPPGTGDVSLTLSQMLGLTGAVVVCTPQKVAQLDVVKAINMFKKLDIPLLGAVENMTGEAFGCGGAREMASANKIPFLGEVPMEAAIREEGDAGRIKHLFDEASPAREPLMAMTRNVAVEIAREVMKGGGGPTLQIL